MSIISLQISMTLCNIQFMTDFKRIEPQSYFKPTNTITIQKTASVTAIQAQGGEPIETVMKNGLVETTNVAKPGDFIITNPSGERYVVPEGKFNARYDPAGDGHYVPKSNPLQAMRLREDVEFKTRWGDMKIVKGGVLVRNGPDDLHGIQSSEFRETYSVQFKDDIRHGMQVADHSLIGPTVGLALSSYALYQKLQDGSPTRLDLAAKNTRLLAQTGIGLNASGILLGGSRLAVKTSQAMEFAWISRGTLSANLTTFNTVASGAAIGLQIGVGIIEFEIARENKDAVRASNAVGTTIGGIAGGMALGSSAAKACAFGFGVAGSFIPGVGTVAGAATAATVCGIGGAIIGSLAGAEAGRHLARWALHDALDEFFNGKKPPIETPAPVAARTTPLMFTDIGIPVLTREEEALFFRSTQPKSEKSLPPAFILTPAPSFMRVGFAH